MLRKIADWFGFGSSAEGNLACHAAHGGNSHEEAGHGHTHGVIDPTIATTSHGIRAIKWSFVILVITGILQIAVVYISGSVALLADTIHNFGDATTAIPLWIAFALVRRPATKTFNYGLGRVEDLAGILIVVIILISAIVAGYEAIDRLINPQTVAQLGWLVGAGIVGFLGNEAVAVFRIRVGRRINSAALIADGYHARTDGLTSLAVVAGAIGVWLGFPLADPIIGLLISAAILGIVWQSGKSVMTRMLDGVESGTVDEIHHAVSHVKGIKKILDVKARWNGHRLQADITIAVDDGLLLGAANSIADKVKSELFAHMPTLAVANVRFGKTEATGQGHHALDSVMVTGKLADGLLEIIDTPAGKRVLLRVSRHAEGMRASVGIERGGGNVETLCLVPVAVDHHQLQSLCSPDEPHEFKATLHLEAGSDVEEFSFSMAKPTGHHHQL